MLGAGGGGLSGEALHPVAVRAVWECRKAFPEAGIIGVGGVASGRDAVEFLMAGADAVQVGTATFRDPRAPWKVLRELGRWCEKKGTTRGRAAGAARGRGAEERRSDERSRDGRVSSGSGVRGAGMEKRASFGVRVAEAVGRLGPLCAGIDPSGALLEAWGLSDDVKGLRSFCGTCVEAFGGVVPVIKPQVAFFERHGSAGMAELERLLVDAARGRTARPGRCQARGHRHDGGGLRRRLVARGQHAGGRRGDGASVSRGGRPRPTRAAGRRHRPRGHRGDPELES